MTVTTTEKKSALALHGASAVRSTPMPARCALGPNERQTLNTALDWYQERQIDPGYQGHFEELYCQEFAQYLGGGYADAVATGTAALLVALAALDLPKGSNVLVSPITDPGTLSAITMLGLKPKLVDAEPNSFNIGPKQVEARIDNNTSCVLVVHAAGQAVAIDEIVAHCHARNIRVLEDCSQAHGTTLRGKKVGTFGDIAAFSTMYRKASITGPTGGVVFTRDVELYHLALAHADRGKPRWREGFDDRNPAHFLFPALNLHAGELDCAIGLASIKRLPATIAKRLQFVSQLAERMLAESVICSPYAYTMEDSPFYLPIFVDDDQITCTKTEFANAILAEGIGLNPHYQYLVEDWPWLSDYLADDYRCVNARTARDKAFCLYLNENYTEREVADTIAAIKKVENYFRK